MENQPKFKRCGKGDRRKNENGGGEVPSNMESFAPNIPLYSHKESTKVLNESALSNEPTQSGSSDAEVLSLLYRGFHSRFV